eukprot:sb/3477073/
MFLSKVYFYGPNYLLLRTILVIEKKRKVPPLFVIYIVIVNPSFCPSIFVFFRAHCSYMNGRNYEVYIFCITIIILLERPSLDPILIVLLTTIPLVFYLVPLRLKQFLFPSD